MVQVSGPIKLATDTPAMVTQVWLRVPQPRLHGDSYVTDMPDTVSVNNGQVSFTAIPGPLLMVLATLQGPLKTVKLIVPDKTTATLRECIEAGGLADDGTLNALQQLAQEIPLMVAEHIASNDTFEAAAATAIDAALADNSTHYAGFTDSRYANQYLKLNADGKIFINTLSIADAGDPTNKIYVDTAVSDKADKSYVDTELADKADKSYVDDVSNSIRWVRRSLLNGEDFNDLTQTGLYLIPLANTMASLLNRPFGSTGPGFVNVVNSDGTVIQDLTNYSDAGPISMRRTTRAGVFQDWVNPAAVTKPFLWTDFNSAVIEGDYDISTYNAVRDAVNRPPFGTIPAAVQVRVRRAGGSRLIQSVTGIVAGGIGERWERNLNSTGAWESWTQIHGDISRAEVLNLLDEFKPEEVQTDRVVTVGDSQVGATYGWANLLAGVSGQTVVNRGKSGNTPDEALLMTGGWRPLINPVALQPGTRVTMTFDGDSPVLGRDFSHNGYVLGKRVSLWYTHSTGEWQALLNAEESPLTLTEPTEWASIYADFEPERLNRRIVWFGGNSIRTGRHRPDETLVSHVQKAYSRALDEWGETTIVCGYVPAYGDTTGRDAADALNTWLNRVVPTQFLDMRHRIQQAAPAILGRELTTAEQQDIADGYLPRPLYREDLVHLIDEAHVKIAKIVAEFPQGASPELAILTNSQKVSTSLMGLFSGTGSPEGKISAPVGSIYTDVLATNGAIRWIKSSGTGNTGWRVEHGDTGWRDITANMASPSALSLGTGAKIAIRRKDHSVIFRVVGPATMGGVFGSIVAAQSGLRPDLDTNSSAAKGASFRNTRVWIRLEDGTSGAVLVESGRAVETIWSTDEAWPATLPGVPF